MRGDSKTGKAKTNESRRAGESWDKNG